MPDLYQIERDHVERAAQGPIEEKCEQVWGEKAGDAEERERHHRVGPVRLRAEKEGEEDESAEERQGYQGIPPA